MNTINNVDGVTFRLYAPSAWDVSVIGDFNNWDYGAHKMNRIATLSAAALLLAACGTNEKESNEVNIEKQTITLQEKWMSLRCVWKLRKHI